MKREQILNADEIAYKYVHGEHDALTDSQEKKDMVEDISNLIKLRLMEQQPEKCQHDFRMKNSENGIYSYCYKCGALPDEQQPISEGRIEEVKKMLMKMIFDLSDEDRGGYQLGIVGRTAVNIDELYTKCD